LTSTVPPTGCSRPAIKVNRVDLPQPDGPMIEMNSPGEAVIEMSFKTNGAFGFISDW
jgi:hypothetical protein